MGENLVHGVSGALSSMVATALLHPFEALRTKMQAEMSSVYFLDYAKKIFREEGLKGIYSGFGSNIINIALSYAMYFFSYKALRTWILQKKPRLTFLDDVYASFVASMVVILVNTPLWTINTRLIKDKSKRFMEVFKQILYKEGPSAFFKGSALSVVLTVNPVLQYSLYEYMKIRFNAKTLIHYFILGAIAKFIATVFTYPILTLRTRHQLNEAKNQSLVDEIISSLRSGVKFDLNTVLALYNGFFSKAVQTVLNSAIILSLHEKITKILTEKFIKTAVRITIAN